jgi:hypothetical protein
MSQTNGLLRAMTSNDVSVAMGRWIELGKDHPAVGGGWLEATAAPLPWTPFNRRRRVNQSTSYKESCDVFE